MSQMITYEKNTPNFNATYTIPFEAIKEISAPTLLCGPIGKDAHKVSERLHKKSGIFTDKQESPKKKTSIT